MSQKSRSKKQARKAPAPRPLENQSAATQPSTAAFGSSSARSFTTDFNPDYSQTIKDLKRIGILAGVFFAVLIALAFVLP